MGYKIVPKVRSKEGLNRNAFLSLAIRLKYVPITRSTEEVLLQFVMGCRSCRTCNKRTVFMYVKIIRRGFDALDDKWNILKLVPVHEWKEF